MVGLGTARQDAVLVQRKNSSLRDFFGGNTTRQGRVWTGWARHGKASQGEDFFNDKGHSMDNQHKIITGYRDLTAEEIALMNDIKAQGELLGQLVERLSNVEGIDIRWVCIGETDLKTGIMALVRAVAQPTSF